MRVEVDEDGLWVRYRDGAVAGTDDEDDERGALYVGWRSLEGFSADDIDHAPPGSGMQVLEVIARDGTLTLLMPAYEISQLFGDVGDQSQRWERARQSSSEPRHAAPPRGAYAWCASAVRSLAVGLLTALGVLGRSTRWVLAAPFAVVRLVRRAFGSAAAALAVVSWRAAIPARRAVRGTRPVVSLASTGHQLEARHASARRAGSTAGLTPVLWVRRRRVAAAGLVGVLFAGGCTAVALSGGNASARPPRPQPSVDLTGNAGSGPDMGKVLGGMARHRHVTFVPASAPPAPAPPSLASAPPLSSHEDFGFAPYWTLPQSSTFDVQGLTTIAYFTIGLNPDGTFVRSGSGWDGYQSQDLADLVTRAHAAGVRVVLTVNDFGQGSLDQLTSSATAPATLSQQLIAAIEAKNLDGVNLDLEGNGAGDQAGLTNLVAQVSTALHKVNPHWQVTMDTYASSAGDPSGFYDIKTLAPYVDAFFVMAYELNLQSPPNPASPLTSGMFSNLTMAEQYSADVDPAKVIMGLPFYGYDWPTTNGTMTATATGAATPITYAQAIADGPQYWDDVTDTAWTSFEVGKQWHEEFYEDATSLYEAAQVAQWFHLAGVGIWALGMDQPGSGLIAALDGFAPAAKLMPSGPTATSPSATTTTSTTTTTTAPAGQTKDTSTTTTSSTTTTTTAPAHTYTGQFGGQPVTLTRATTAPTGAETSAGTLTGFTTDDPTLSCLSSAPSLPVVSFAGDPTVDAVITTTPAQCVAATLTFTVPGSGGSTGSGNSQPSGGSPPPSG